MRPNRAFQRAMHSLAHPISLGAIVLLLFNDHWLRWNHPSWLTGKLGDFAWLAFAPFIAALLLAWVIPARWKRQETYVGGLSIALIGLWFGLAKTVPLVHEWTAVAWNNVIGWQGSLRLDATDLLTLPALFISAWVWWRVGTLPGGLFGAARAKREPHPPTPSPSAPLEVGKGRHWWGSRRWRRGAGARNGSDVSHIRGLQKKPTFERDGREWVWKPLAYVAFGLGIVATLASSEPIYYYPNSGVTVICQDGDKLVIPIDTWPQKVRDPNTDALNPTYLDIPQTFVFTSEDGGRGWSERLISDYQRPFRCSDPASNHASDPNNPDVRYRWQAGGPIERSSDGGASWSVEKMIPEVWQDVRRHYNRPSENHSAHTYIPGPVSGLVDPVTGNLVLAMSWDGVLVRTISGEWQWRKVSDEYYLAEITVSQRMGGILFYELWLAGALGFLIICSAATYLGTGWQPDVRLVWLLMGWMMWIVLTLFLLPSVKDFLNSDGLGIIFLSLGSLLFLALPQMLWAFFDFVVSFRRYILPVVGMGLLAAGLFLLPFILWARGTIPPYTTAWVFALMLAGCGVTAAYWQLKRVLPVAVSPPPKRVVKIPVRGDE
ncbi:MAG TPA: hypothetical protein PLQ56_14210 [Aggregatilineales bacterium]|nr:hypothetical protein [Aggregatilineales bacterium]